MIHSMNPVTTPVKPVSSNDMRSTPTRLSDSKVTSVVDSNTTKVNNDASTVIRKNQQHGENIAVVKPSALVTEDRDLSVNNKKETQDQDLVVPVNRGKSEEELSEMVSDLNSSIQELQRNLQFSVDKDLGQIVVNITDKKTDEVIRQIPSEEFLDLARNLQEMTDSNRITPSANIKGNAEGALINSKV